MITYAPGEPPVIIVPVPEKVLTEDELYRIWQMEKYSNQRYNGISELDRERFKDYDFEFRDMYEHAESMNFMMDHASDKLKARLRKEYKFT